MNIIELNNVSGEFEILLSFFVPFLVNLAVVRMKDRPNSLEIASQRRTVLGQVVSVTSNEALKKR
jgi:hypothetical protein